MDLKLSSKFSELSAMDLQEVDGGEWEWYYDVIIWVVSPPGLGNIIANDLERVYKDTYNKTFAMNS